MTESIKAPVANAERRMPQIDSGEVLDKHKLEQQKKLEDIRRLVEKQAASSETIIDKEEEIEEKNEAENEKLHFASDQTYVSHSFKQMAYRRVIKRLRQNLPTIYKALSYVMNPPFADWLFESLAKSVGRTSTVLGAATGLAVGSVAIAFISESNNKDLGFMPYLLIIVGGMLVGYLLEKTTRLFRNA